MLRQLLLPACLLALPVIAATQTSLPPVDALRQAYAHRESIAFSRQKVEEARRNAGAAGAYPATRMDLGRDLLPKHADIMGSADFLVYQPLDVFNKSGALRRQGDAGVNSALAVFRQTALDLQQEVLTAYANLLSAKRLLELAKTQQEVAEQVRISTAKRVDARDLPEIQADRAALEVERIDGLVADRQAAVDTARIRFEGALGIDGVADDPQLTEIEAPSEPTGDPTLSRPELLSLRADEAQAVADERVARQGMLPDLEIQAGRNSFNEAPIYGARLQLSANLLDWGANRQKVRAAEVRRKAAEDALSDKVRLARKDIEAARVELQAADRSVANYSKLADGAKTLLARARRGFDLGANSLLDVLDARRALSDAQELTVTAQLRRDLAVEGLLRAEGRLLEEPK